MSAQELSAAQKLATRFTAWLIDVGRAIQNGDLDDRQAALEQAELLVALINEMLPDD